MPIKVINSGIVSTDEDPNNPVKSRNDRKSYPDEGIPFRKKGNVVTNAVARTEGLMAISEGPTAPPTIRRQREIAERDQCGNSSETSQPYKTLGSMHPVLHLKVVKYSQNKKEGKTQKRKIRLARRRGQSANDDEDSDDEESRKKKQQEQDESNKTVVDPLDEIRSAHARRHGAYLGSGKHLPVHSGEFYQLQNCVNAGDRRVKGVRAGHSSAMYLTPRSAIERAQWASEHALETVGQGADTENSEIDGAGELKSSMLREPKRVPQRPSGHRTGGKSVRKGIRKPRRGSNDHVSVKKKVTLKEKLDVLENQLLHPGSSDNRVDSHGDRPLPSVPKPTVASQRDRRHDAPNSSAKGGTNFPAISHSARSRQRNNVLKAEHDMMQSRVQLQERGVSSVRNLLETRDEFVESCAELEGRLQAELAHLEFERPERYDRKFKAFCNRFDAYLENITHADVKQEMKVMRDTAEVSRIIDHDANLSRNEWYAECRRIAFELAVTTGGSIPPPVMRFLKIMQTVVEDDWELNEHLFFDLLIHGLRPDDHKSLELHRVMSFVRTDVLRPPIDQASFIRWYQENNIEIPRNLLQQ